MRCLSVIMCVYVFVYMNGLQTKGSLSNLFHFPIYQTSSTSALLRQGQNVSKQLLPRLTESQESKRQNQITTHSCAQPFSCFLTVSALTRRNQYLPCPALVSSFVIWWSSSKVNGIKPESACLARLWSVESPMHHSEDVHRLEVQVFQHF